MSVRVRAALAVVLIVVLGPAGVRGEGARIDGTDLVRAREMLFVIKGAVLEHYHDPTFKGLNINAHFDAARKRLALAATLDEAYGMIAETLTALGDSHTYFLPPDSPLTYEHGWEMQPVGDEFFISTVDPASDAAAKGVHPGDRVIQVEGVPLSRTSWPVLRQAHRVFSQRMALRVVVEPPGEAPREVELRAKIGRRQDTFDPDNVAGHLAVEREARLRASRMSTVGDVRIWKLPGFDLEPADIDFLAKEAFRPGVSALVLDLRGNGGGAVPALVQLTRHFFNQDVHIAVLKGRQTHRLSATRRKNHFGGRLTVLVDGGTASAGEIFARVVQLEQRGLVVGDRTAGCVMQSQIFVSAIPLIESTLTYGVSVTQADVIMRDGRSLERAGVNPDVRVIPTPEDLASGRDPVLARAVAMLDGSLDAATAGGLFPRRW